MALPDDQSLQIELLRLLSRAPDGRMHCNDVYQELAKLYPQLTREEREAPYRSSLSHFANRVQFARLHLVNKGYLLRPFSGGGRGHWAIAAAGRKAIATIEDLSVRLLAELESS